MVLSTISFATLGGCSDTSDDSAPAAAGPCVAARDVSADVPSAAGIAVTVAAADDRFVPACIAVASEGEVTVVVRNDGRHPHNLTVAGAASVAVDAGQVGFVSVMVGDGGLRFTCTIHRGMEGRFTVTG